MSSTIPVQPSGHFEPYISLFISYGIGVVLLLCVVGYAWIRWRQYARDAKLAKSALDPNAELREGPAIICGVVELAAEKPEAVKVEIEQHATESESSGKWSHKWTEVDRRVHVAPFYLRRPQGERIRIQPTNRVFLVDEMDGCIHVDLLRRKRIVELVPDEEVIATGVLRRDFDPEGRPPGYRDSPLGWILDPPHGSRMHLSSEPLENRFVRWRSFHRTATILLLLAFGGVQVLLLTYHYRVLHGETSTATVLSKDHYITKDDDGDNVHHWEALAVTPWGEMHREEIEHSSFLEIEKDSIVPIRHSGRKFVQFGSRSRLHYTIGLLVIGVFATAIGLYVALIKRKKAWYSTEVVDHGSGRIAPNTGLDEQE